jgi:hypothetical protein
MYQQIQNAITNFCNSFIGTLSFFSTFYILIFLSAETHSQKIPESMDRMAHFPNDQKAIFGKFFFAVAPFLNNSVLLVDPTLS